MKNFQLLTGEHEKSIKEIQEWKIKEEKLQNEISTLEEKLKEYEKQIEISDQHQLEFSHKDAQR